MNRVGTQNNQKTIYSANNESTNISEKQKKQSQQKQEGAIFAGNLDILQPGLFAKKEKMKKNALKVLIDAFSSDQEIDKALDKRRSHVAELNKRATEIIKEISHIDELKADLKKRFGIEDDSIEQQDLELMEKKIDYMMGISDTPLTKEEWERLKNMGPLTEYQEAALEYHSMKANKTKEFLTLRDTMKAENESIEAAERERVKSHPIVDAQKDKDKLLETANKEFVYGLMEQVKEKIDENLEENQEKIDELKEKKEKEEEETRKKEASEEVRNVNDTQVMDSTILPDDIDWNQVVRKIKAMANKENLLAEDIKGLTVDKQL